MIDLLRPFAARLIAAWAPALAVWLTDKVGFPITAEMIESMLWFGLAYSIAGPLHKFINRWVNPGDAASITMSSLEKGQHDSLKRAEANDVRPV